MKLQGWSITAWVAGIILLMLAIFFVLSGWSAETITAGIDYTGRSSLFLFSIAFTASSIYSLWKTPLTTWTLHNRRYIGLSFAASHFIHLILIVLISFVFPEPFLEDQPMGKWIFGGIGYVFIFLMALTSTDRAQQWMGMKHWKRLHLIGSHWLWTVFLLTYVGHTREDPKFYIPFLVYTLALLPLRLIKHTHPKAPQGAASLNH